MPSTSTYYESYWAFRVQKDYLYRWPSHERARLAIEYLRPILPADARVLDLGCGEGHFGKSVRAAAADWQLWGGDISPTALKNARPYYDSVAAFDIGSDDWPDSLAKGAFDAIVCLEVLEHLFTPYEAIERLDAALGRDGVIVASFPNFAFWRNRLKAARGVFPEEQVFRSADHIHYFTAATFRSLFNKCGFSGSYVGALMEYPRFTRRLLGKLIPTAGAEKPARFFGYQLIYAFRRFNNGAEEGKCFSKKRCG